MPKTEVRGEQIKDASVDLTLDVTGTLPVAKGGTGVATLGTNNALLGNGTSPVQGVSPATTGNVLTANGSTWISAAPSGGLGSFTTLFVASSTASVGDQAKANYVCDGTADEVQINAALAAVATAGGKVVLSPGTFNLAATIAIIGSGNADSPLVALSGTGADSTMLAPASGVHAITMTLTPKVRIEDIEFVLSGSSDGIRCTAPTSGANDRRGFWMSRFINLRFSGDFAGTGWAMNLESPFRSTFINIQSSGVKNGFWLKSHYANFNPGNCVFIDCHIEVLANGTAYFIDTADAGGFFNIMSFIECDCYDGTGSTTSIGWRFKGSTNSYFTSRDIRVLHSNVEGFNTAVSIEHSAGITFFGAYIDTKTSGTVFHCSSDSVNNFLSAEYIYVPSPKTTKAINDLNTDALKPNTFRDCFARVETGGTLTVTKSSATVLEGLYRDSDGSGTYPTEWQGQTTGLVIKDEGTELFRGTRSINFVGAGVAVTNSGPDATVTISGGGGGVSDGDKGDITVSATGATWTIDNDVVTYAKMQNVSATSRIMGRATASAGDMEELTAAQTKTILALVKGDVGLGNVDNTADTAKPVSTAQQTALDAKLNAVFTINAQTGSYTLVLTDATKFIQMNVAGANNLTVPPNSSVAFPIGTRIEGHQLGAGQTTIVAGSGVTLQAAGAQLKARVQYSGFSLVKTATDTWAVFGDLAS